MTDNQQQGKPQDQGEIKVHNWNADAIAHAETQMGWGWDRKDVESVANFYRHYINFITSPSSSIPTEVQKEEYKSVEELSNEYADSKVPNANTNDAPYYTTGDRWDDINESFKAGFIAASPKGKEESFLGVLVENYEAAKSGIKLFGENPLDRIKYEVIAKEYEDLISIYRHQNKTPMAKYRGPEYCPQCGKVLQPIHDNIPGFVGDTFRGYKPCDHKAESPAPQPKDTSCMQDDSEPLIAELIRLYNKHGEESTRLVLEAYKKAKEATY